MAESGVIRCRVIYHGRVQGVCFRAISRELSRRHAVVGYVRNRPDGTVELEAQGTPAEVDAFLSEIADNFAGYIRDTQRSTVPLRSDETAFEIRY